MLLLILNDLQLYNGHDVTWGNVPNMVQAHKLIRQSGYPNFLKMRIPVNTQLNIPKWRSYLHDYWDQQLVDLLEFGFPLDFNRMCPLVSTEQNHKSATEFSQHIDAYIQEELKYGALYGPFVEKPFPCHISPFLTRLKQNSDNKSHC